MLTMDGIASLMMSGLMGLVVSRCVLLSCVSVCFTFLTLFFNYNRHEAERQIDWRGVFPFYQFMPRCKKFAPIGQLPADKTSSSTAALKISLRYINLSFPKSEKTRIFVRLNGLSENVGNWFQNHFFFVAKS